MIDIMSKMIRSNELMIIDGYRGVINNEPDGYCSETNINIDEIEPIPLTYEFLEKNGLLCDEFHNTNIICKRDTPFNILDGVQISYVHELQNVLRMCGLSDLSGNFKF